MATKRGAKRTVGKKEVSLEQKEIVTAPIINETTYSVDNKEELKGVPSAPINTSETEPLQQSPLIKSSEEKKPMRKEIKVLVILVIILLIVDVLSLYLYYKPDLSGLFKFNTGRAVDNTTPEKTGKCSDGTASNSCSKNKPYFCYEEELVKKAASCGCPSGYKVAFQDCVKSA